jgi:hypothetical protein
MSNAHVHFLDKDKRPAKPGEEVTFSFHCPHFGQQCGRLLIAGRSPELRRDGQNDNGGRAMWDWNGDRDKPTFSPSINCVGCWHGYIEGGRCVSVAKADEPEAAIA